MKRTTIILSTLLATMAGGTLALGGGTPLTTERVAFGLATPLYVLQAPGDNDRLFILEQRSGNQGRVRILDLTQDPPVLLATPVLSLTVATGNEQGLLGMAFHPDFQSNGLFYVHYNPPAGTTIIAEYQMSAANPNIADVGTARSIYQVAQPFSNHNGGWIGFGMDGYLYIALGDGGSANDPGNRAQNLNIALGKMLRIDVNGDDFPGSPTQNFAVPSDNPFAGGGGLPEIWAYGLRNPYRSSFDRETGDIYIGDVGQNAWEEIDFEPANSLGGVNYGWRCYEGNTPFITTGCPPMSTLEFPIHVYNHSADGFSCSVTGGYVYRGEAICDLQGTYFFADFCSNRIKSFRYDQVGGLTEFEDRTTELAPGGGLSITQITSFGEDNAGELYITDRGGEVFKIIPNGPANPCALLGDMNCDGLISVSDIGPFVLALTDPAGYAAMFPDCDINNGDINGDMQVSVGDIGAFVALLTGA